MSRCPSGVSSRNAAGWGRQSRVCAEQGLGDRGTDFSGDLPSKQGHGLGGPAPWDLSRWAPGRAFLPYGIHAGTEPAWQTCEQDSVSWNVNIWVQGDRVRANTSYTWGAFL